MKLGIWLEANSTKKSDAPRTALAGITAKTVNPASKRVLPLLKS